MFKIMMFFKEIFLSYRKYYLVLLYQLNTNSVQNLTTSFHTQQLKLFFPKKTVELFLNGGVSIILVAFIKKAEQRLFDILTIEFYIFL